MWSGYDNEGCMPGDRQILEKNKAAVTCAFLCGSHLEECTLPKYHREDCVCLSEECGGASEDANRVMPEACPHDWRHKKFPDHGVEPSVDPLIPFVGLPTKVMILGVTYFCFNCKAEIKLTAQNCRKSVNEIIEECLGD